MTKFISDLPKTNPDGFLRLIYRIDPIAAIRVASQWVGANATLQQGHAAWALMCRQTIVPRCEYCQWAMFDGDVHASCEEVLNRAWEECYASYGIDEELEADDDRVDYKTVYSRAYAHFGNDELAREAASLCPGDFM